MKVQRTLFFAALCMFGTVTGAFAVDFVAKGEWDTYFNFGEVSMFKKPYDSRSSLGNVDVFEPQTRIRVQLDAVASDNLSGSLQFEMGTYSWGLAKQDAQDRDGASMSERSVSVRVKRAYLDWQVPSTELRLRMGIQGVALPNAAGGSAVMDEDMTALSVSYRLSDHVGITAAWARPYNDNYTQGEFGGKDASTAYDNFDLGILAVPLTFDGISVTPWAMFGMMGQNAARHQLRYGEEGLYPGSDSLYIQRGLFPVDLSQRSQLVSHNELRFGFTRSYATMFWAGIPIKISAFDPFNIEFDANYGYMSGFGRYDDLRTGRRNDSKREGYVLKALVEYKMDWGVPGVFGWYGSGDSSLRNGSGRMPYVAPGGDFSSFGLTDYYGDFRNLAIGERIDTGYSGTWALGLRLTDLSFLDDLSHTLRAIYWRGTNEVGMAKALRTNLSMESAGLPSGSLAWNNEPAETLYLTRNDYLLEFNLDSTYKIYENLQACVELGYIVNGVDKSTWKWSGNRRDDAWKATVSLRYTF